MRKSLRFSCGNWGWWGEKTKMSVYKLVIAVVAIAFSSGASSETAKVMEGIQPKWVLAPPVISAADPPKDALIQVKFLDTQVRVSRKGQETYIAQRFKFLRPEALQAANLRFAWQPTSGQLTVCCDPQSS